MSEELSVENILIQVRSKLKLDKIQLWLLPYHNDNGPVTTELEELSSKCAESLKIPFERCFEAICDLQSNAMGKLQARKRFETEGIATLQVRVPHNSSNDKGPLSINIKLSQNGLDLQALIAKELKVIQQSLKLISAGKVIVLNESLQQQSICNNQQIMAISVHVPNAIDKDGNPVAAANNNNNDDIYDLARKTREDAHLIISRQSNLMQMEDQDGNPIHLPVRERESMMMALSLHEKGKSILLKKNYNNALIFFLEADQEFSICTSEMLTTVDNYALLNLDIVWCYLCLKSVTQLPDAERRLKICEANFKKTYGENCERLIKLKGKTGNERALIMRLHVMQAVVLFHQNRRNESKRLFQLASSELTKLKLNDDSILSLTQMGFTDVEARVALRACESNVGQAITYIMEKREQRKKARQRYDIEHSFDTILKNFNITDKSWVNPKNMVQLVEMGFDKQLCAMALFKSNNELGQAIDLLQNDKSSLIIEAKNLFKADKKLSDELVTIGFPRSIADWALNQSLNDKSSAIDSLLKMKEQGTYDEFEAILLSKGAGGSSSASSTSSMMGAGSRIDLEAARNLLSGDSQVQDAYNRFSEDIEQVDDSYLDFDLIEEENIISEYLAYLSM